MATILVVEDEANIARAVRDRLRREGHEVESVSSGPDALRWLHDRSPDLIILDLLMPDMDGFEVVRRVRADPSRPRVPIMLLTVLPEDEKIAELGVDAYLTKPYRNSDLVRQVQELLRKAEV